MHLNWVVSNTQWWARKLPVRGDMQMQEINVSCGLPIRQSNNDIHYSRKRSNWHDEPNFTNLNANLKLSRFGKVQARMTRARRILNGSQTQNKTTTKQKARKPATTHGHNQRNKAFGHDPVRLRVSHPNRSKQTRKQKGSHLVPWSSHHWKSVSNYGQRAHEN